MPVQDFYPLDANPDLRIQTSSLTQLLLFLRYLVASGGQYRDEQVGVSLDPDPWPAQAGPFVVVHPGEHRLVDGQWDGAGAFLSGYEGEFIIRLVDQAMRDELGRDDSALLAMNTGLIDRGMQLIEFLTGEAAAAKLIQSGFAQQPLRPSIIAEPTYHTGGRLGKDKRSFKSDRRWRGIDITFLTSWTHSYQRGMTTVPVFTPSTGGSSITNLLLGVRDLVVAGGFYMRPQVFITLDPDPWPTLSGPFCAIRMGSQGLIDDQWGGAGAYLGGYKGQIIVRVADQAVRDEIGRDDSALMTTELGLLDRGIAMVEFLTGNTVGSTLLGSGLVQRDLVPRRISQPTYRRGDRRWRGIDLVFDAQWTHVYKTSM